MQSDDDESFKWGEEVVAVRLGRRCPAKDPEFQRLPTESRRVPGTTNAVMESQEGLIHIEDPFDTERNLNCVFAPGRNVALRVAVEAEAHRAKERRGRARAPVLSPK